MVKRQTPSAYLQNTSGICEVDVWGEVCKVVLIFIAGACFTVVILAACKGLMK